MRRYTSGSRPGITGEDPLGPDVGSQDQWKFPDLRRRPLSLEEKRMIIQVTHWIIKNRVIIQQKRSVNQ